MNKKVALGIVALAILVAAVIGIVSMPGPSSVTGNVVKTAGGDVREFKMESFTEIIDGKYYPQYSIKEITVKKGDLVRIEINATSGKHDFKIDEFGVYSETPTGKAIVIEFVAKEAGEFVYYCTQPKHRELGHWGTLKVTE